jgi:hypothetical protein
MLEFCGGKYTAVRDRHQWKLSEHYAGRGRDGKPKMQSRRTYHATLDQVCHTVIDREAGHAPNAERLLESLLDARRMLTHACDQGCSG